MTTPINSIISLSKLEGLIKVAAPQNFKPKIEKKIPSFYIVDSQSEKYVKPNFSYESETLKEGKLPKIILISAAGATGKTELTHYLSVSLGVPIFDLSSHTPVGSNSLTGLFYDTLGPDGLASFINNLNRGKAAMLIDALDEGHLKTNAAAFNVFLTEIANIAKDCEGMPFVLLGRTNVVDNCTLFFWEMGIQADLLHIEPFTMVQAKEFIDKRLGNNNFEQQYRTVRDYILDSVQGFFRNDAEIAMRDSQMFIGYAPVLLSISVLLENTRNFHALHEDLKSKNDKGVDLVLDIVSMIMKRDRENKILVAIRERLLRLYNEEFNLKVEQLAYSEDEQCVRIVQYVLGEKSTFGFTDDLGFNQQYEEMADDWIKEHPFIQNGKIQNVVFESYVIAKLMLMPKYEKLIIRYLQQYYKSAFMLFFIFDKLSKDREIRACFLPYLYSSLKSLDDKNNFYSLEIYSELEDVELEDSVECVVEFSNDKNTAQDFEFVMVMDKEASLNFNNSVSNVHIHAPISLSFSSKKVEFQSPVNIVCSIINIAVEEIICESREEGDIYLECRDFKVDYSSSQPLQVLDYGNGKTKFLIVCESKLAYPFSKFLVKNFELDDLDNATMEKYLRLRKILMQFRSHSKGGLGKLMDKIEHPRILKNDLGRSVLDKLKELQIIYGDAHLYKLNKDFLSKYLGVTYLELKRKEINSKVIDFLKSINVQKVLV